MTGLRRFIEAHFSLVLVLSCLAGLILPGLPTLPNVSVVVALALLMFTSCYRLRDGGLAAIRWGNVALFTLLRYAVLPIMLWLVATLLVPRYATGIFLLSVLPAAVSSPAFAAIYGGTVAPAFAVAIVSQLLAPFLIPLQFAWMSGVAVAPSPTALFSTMIWCILLPMTVYVGTKRHARSAAWMYANNKLLSVLLVAFVIALAVAKQRTVILATGPNLLLILAICLACFALYIMIGWCLGGEDRAERITFAACSAFNNAALGVSLALLHFGPDVLLFVAVSEIAWALLPGMFKGWLRVMGHGS